MKTATYFSDGAAERTRTHKRRFEKAVEMLGEFSLDSGIFLDQRLFAF